VLLEEGLERVEEGHAALVEYGLLDDLVGPPQHRRRDRKAEDFGGLEIDHELELGWLLDGEIGWLRALEDLVDKVRASVVPAHDAGPVREEKP
jgi:hypothetical protein